MTCLVLLIQQVERKQCVFMQVGWLVAPREVIITSRFTVVFTPLAHDQGLFITNFTFNLCANLTRHQPHRQPTFPTSSSLTLAALIVAVTV